MILHKGCEPIRIAGIVHSDEVVHIVVEGCAAAAQGWEGLLARLAIEELSTKRTKGLFRRTWKSCDCTLEK